MRNSSPPNRATVSCSRAHSLQAFGNVLQDQVAERVSERVVDVFEAVEIEEQKRNFVILAAGAGQCLGQSILQKSPIGQPRESIVVGQVLDPLLGDLAVGDVLLDGDEVSIGRTAEICVTGVIVISSV